ncbi:RsmD family RNA methyltransferase, partial [Candidatus Saccharibacteria bacterium]|nr:RsmD family RNA methyltransferase [Candidatus Saccharibacteria bacterium]
MSNIKITSVKFRGRTIKSPDSKATHPMGAREKLALFNMIADYLPGANVLDAYAGSGALGIEAL